MNQRCDQIVEHIFAFEERHILEVVSVVKEEPLFSSLSSEEFLVEHINAFVEELPAVARTIEEAWAAGRMAGADALIGEIYLPEVHPDVVAAVIGERRQQPDEALGIIETRTVAAVLGAADAGVKGAQVTLLEILMADGLGGKGYLLFAGTVSEVEAAVDLGVSSITDASLLVASDVIARLDPEMWANLMEHAAFGDRVRPPRSEM